MSFNIKRANHGNSARSSIRRSIRKRLKHNIHERLRDASPFNAPDEDEDAWLDELFVKRATIEEVTGRASSIFRWRVKYMYTIKVQWSIGKTTSVYRSYDDFFRMQMRLLDHFGESPKSEERTIPILPGRAIWTIGTRDNVTRMQPKIQNYMDELLEMPYKTSRCNEVLNFYRYRDSDPNEVMVQVPGELLYRKPDKKDSENFVRAGFRRSIRKLRRPFVRTGSLRSMTDEERDRENNANYDVEPTTADDGLPDDDKQPKKKPASAKKMPPKVKIGLFSDPL